MIIEAKPMLISILDLKYKLIKDAKSAKSAERHNTLNYVVSELEKIIDFHTRIEDEK